MVVGSSYNPAPVGPAFVKLAWWAFMAAAVFWTLVFRFASESEALPEFVYVNF